MKPKNTVIIAASAAALVILIGAGSVYAGRHAWRTERIKAHVLDVLEDALEKEPLSASQEQAIGGALDRAVAESAAMRTERRKMAERALAAFEADTLDETALDQLANEHLAQMRAHVLTTVREVHDVLTPGQRRELAAFAREKAAQHEAGGWHHGF